MSTDDLIILRSPFNGETIQMTAESCPPAMLIALTQPEVGYVHLNPKRSQPKQKEIRDGIR